MLKKISLSLISLLSSLALLTSALNGADLGENDKDQISAFVDMLDQMSRFSPIETAGSHGSYGTHIGLGASSLKVKDPSSLHSEVMGIDNAKDEDNLAFAKLIVVQGTPFPVDLGLAFGNLTNTRIYQMGGYAQWTIFESLDFPALAFRGAYNKISGLENVNLSRASASTVASYGILRYFTIFAGINLNYQKLEMTYEPKENEATALQNQTGDSYVEGFERKTNTFSRSHTFGLRAVFLPPFVSALAELERNSTGVSTYAAKVSLIL